MKNTKSLSPFFTSVSPLNTDTMCELFSPLPPVLSPLKLDCVRCTGLGFQSAARRCRDGTGVRYSSTWSSQSSISRGVERSAHITWRTVPAPAAG